MHGERGERGARTARARKERDKDTSSSASSERAPRHGGALAWWRSALGCACFAVAAYVGYLGYLETRVNTPFDEHKVVQFSGLDVPERFWGSYRPGHYLGLRTREPQSIATGLMWYSPTRLRPGGDGIRHWCSQADGLRRYGWLRHDGESMGEQELLDGPLRLSTSFLKRAGGQHGGDWTVRISVDLDPTSPEYDSTLEGNETVSLVWYTSSDGAAGAELRPSHESGVTGVRGYSPATGNFKLSLLPYKGTVLHESYLSTVSLGAALLRETVVSSLRLARESSGQQWIALAGELLGQPTDKSKPEPTLVATQLTVRVPFSLDVSYESGSVQIRPHPLSGKFYSSELAAARQTFEQRFQDTFGLQAKGFNASAVQFAQSALSNLVGGIGYFYGSSRVQSPHTREPVPYWRAPLYTAVPSRSHFPRGFLWDEGFHGLLIARWDRNIALDIMAHWFDLMNVEGWIPREQILGVEAQARVPEEFVTQRNSNANPPTFFLTLLQLLGDNPDPLPPTAPHYLLLERMFPRLQAWYNWFNTTQAGELPGTYRWRGRDAAASAELNPKTLTSGLDDYPRASHPNSAERHVDLRCWMQLGARALAVAATALGRPTTAVRYQQHADALADPAMLAALHWSSYTDSFSDYGLHTDAVTLRRTGTTGGRGGSAGGGPVRVALRAPEPRLVDSALGYVSLFPLLLKVLPTDCPRLGKLIAQLTRPDLLWTPYGLRSLSRSSPLYMKRNTQHDPPYWRGQVWLNINYLAVAALHHYGEQPGPHAAAARNVYSRLRTNLIDNVMREYWRTGYLWEQYSDTTGQGAGCRPFTGWSSLVVLIMAEQY